MSHAWVTYYSMSEDEYKVAVAQRKVVLESKAKDKQKAGAGERLAASAALPAR